MPDAAGSEKGVKKQNGTLGRGAQAAIWTALIAAAGTFATTGIPQIIALFSARPPLETVQDMLAEQADKLAEATNRNVDAIAKLDTLLRQQQDELSKLKGCVDTLKDMLAARAARASGRAPTPVDLPKVLKDAAATLKGVDESKMELVKVEKMERPWEQVQAQIP